ncbi:MAG TPA: DNA repair protein RecO [Acidobacteriota bacterium]|nr:DNA repair protein RecO [Acidobacteriota bacterium]
MALYETEAIVLRHHTLSDSDRIIVFMTREYGRIRAVAQGVKKLRNRLAGSLEPLSHVAMEFRMRNDNNLGKITRAELLHSFLGKNPDLKQMCAFSYFAEIANEMVPENQESGRLFRLLFSTLRAGEKYCVTPSLLRYFEIWCLRLSGLLPNYATCSHCGKYVKDDGFFAWVETGQGRCYDCAQGRGINVRAKACVMLDEMMSLSPDKFMVLPHETGAVMDIERLAHKIMCFHLEKQLKSYRILKEVFQN